MEKLTSVILTLFVISCGSNQVSNISSDSPSSCPQYLSEKDLPPLPELANEKFRGNGNRFMVNTLKWKPFHFVKDSMIPLNSDHQLQAKFDYGAVVHKDLEGEDVEGFIIKSGETEWRDLGTFTTDSDGKIYFNDFPQEVGEYAIKFIVKGDHSIATGRISMIDYPRQSVLFDLDGTLTKDDLEAAKDYLNIRDAIAMGGALELVNYYENLNYQIVYLTARPYILLPSTQEWIEKTGLPRGHLYSPVSFGEALNKGEHAKFKADYINYLQDEVGLDFVAVYGNASTDIEAYEIAGIPKDRTFIIGKNGGNQGTQPINNNYFDHVNQYLPSLNFPAMQCS